MRARRSALRATQAPPRGRRLGSAPVLAGDHCAQEAFAATQSLSAHFVQKRHWAALKDTLVTEGTLRYEHSASCVEDGESPPRARLTLDGKTATMRFPALNHHADVRSRRRARDGQGLREHHRGAQGGLGAVGPALWVKIVKASPLSLELVPRSAAVANVVFELRLDFNASPDLVGVVLEEPGGDSTEIAFRDHVVKMDGK